MNIGVLYVYLIGFVVLLLVIKNLGLLVFVIWIDMVLFFLVVIF